MELTQFIIAIVSFALLLCSTFAGIGWFVGKKIIDLKDSQHASALSTVESVGKMTAEIASASGEMSKISVELNNLSGQLHETNETMKETIKRVNEHDREIAILKDRVSDRRSA